MAGAVTSPLAGATGTTFMPKGVGRYADVWDDVASQAMPRTMPDALRWAQSVHMIDGTLAQASKRVASYFVTDVDVKPYSSRGEKKLSADEKQKVVDFLNKTIRIRTIANYAAVNRLVFGNVFMSLMVPFRRYLTCNGKTADGHNCGYEAPLEKIGNTPAYEFQFTNFEFHAKCPVCKYTGAWRHIDRRGDAESDIIVKFWNPHDIEVLDDPLRDEQAFIWKIPQYYRQMIREGKLFHLCRANWEVIQAVKHGNHLLFDPGVIHHMRDKPLSGIYSGGWGMPPSVTNFRQAWHVQMLRRLNEAICQEFIVPFRVISPEARAGGASPESSDPVLGTNLGQFRAHMANMIRRHRKDPAEIQISPVPIHYQILGGEANQLAPFQLIDQAIDALLNAFGIPAELYKGTLSLQAAPAALRLFESHWAPLVDDLNLMLGWIVDRAAMILNWEPVDATFKRVRTADDLNRQMALIQLMMAGRVSQSTGLAALDLGFAQEQDQLIEEQEYVQDRTQEMQEQAQAKQQQQGLLQASQQPPPGGQGQAGGAPPPSGSTTSTPQDLDNKAQQIAEKLQAMPDTQRRSELLELKKADGSLHALVSQKLDDMKQTTDTAGGAMLRAGQMGGGGGGQSQPAQAGPPKQAGVLPPRLRTPMMGAPSFDAWQRRTPLKHAG